MSSQSNNIVLFPFMAQGHIIPFLSLALKLEQHLPNHTITFINTPQNIKNLKQTLPHNSFIKLLEIPFPGVETTANLSPPLIRCLIDDSVALKPAFEKLITSQTKSSVIVCIISDMFFPWTAGIARELGALHAIFIAGSGYGMAGWHATWLNLPHLEPNVSDEFWLPGFPKGYKFKTKNLPEITVLPWKYGQEIFHKWKETDAILLNTVEEFDQIGLTYFRQNFPNCSVYAIGPILNKAHINHASTNNHECIKWLNSMPKKSILYVAFGSQASPSQTQTMELAKALEASNVNFLWAIRSPSSFITTTTTTAATATSTTDDNNSAIKDILPTGFMDRITASNKGLLFEKWAPQIEILSHESIGAFFTHCGWNSIIEGLSNGLPMLMWPMGADQPFNAQFLENEIGVANAVSFECEEIIKKIKMVMKGDHEGNVMGRKAYEVKEIIENASLDEGGVKGSSVKAFEKFVNSFLVRNKKD